MGFGAAAFALFGTLLFSAPVFPATSSHLISIRQMRFDPRELTVDVGDTVEWNNGDIFTHTVTANDGRFDSGPITSGSSWRFTAKEAGTISYHCGPHPNMTALLIVKAGGESHEHVHGEGAEEGSLKWHPPTQPDQLHPLLVNFTAALLPLAFLSDLLGRISRRRSLQSAGFWLTVYAAAVTPFTALAGWWWRANEPANMHHDVIVVHQWLGTAAAFLFIILALWRLRLNRREVSPTIAYLAFEFIVLLALVYQASLGGAMVFG